MHPCCAPCTRDQTSCHAHGRLPCHSISLLPGAPNPQLTYTQPTLNPQAGRQGELPKGSVRLGASSTGATLYIEPAPCVPLNNAEVLLSEREEQEVARVLGLLSSLVGVG